jgi:hypothetical protein
VLVSFNQEPLVSLCHAMVGSSKENRTAALKSHPLSRVDRTTPYAARPRPKTCAICPGPAQFVLLGLSNGTYYCFCLKCIS